MWRDEMKAEQVDKSIQLLALLQHKALKARNLFFGVQERARFFFPPPQPFQDCRSVPDRGWREPNISREKEKRLEMCCYRQQAVTPKARSASTLNRLCGSGVRRRGGSR